MPIAAPPAFAPTFVRVQVEEHEQLPDGCSMRFKAVEAARAVRRIKYVTDDADSPVLWDVEGRDADDAAASAWASTVEDSSAGTSVLIHGGAHGLRLRPVGGGDAVAEPYLLVSREAVVEWG